MDKLKALASIPLVFVVTGAYLVTSVVGTLAYCAVMAIMPKEKLDGCGWCDAKEGQVHEDWCNNS